MSAGLDQPKKGREVPRPQRIPLGEGAGVLFKIVDGPQHGAVPARLPQPGQSGPEIRRLHLTPSCASTASISFRMAANSPVNSLWLPRVSVTQRVIPAGSSPAAWIFSILGEAGSAKSAKMTPPTALASWSS